MTVTPTACSMPMYRTLTQRGALYPQPYIEEPTVQVRTQAELRALVRAVALAEALAEAQARGGKPRVPIWARKTPAHEEARARAEARAAEEAESRAWEWARARMVAHALAYGQPLVQARMMALSPSAADEGQTKARAEAHTVTYDELLADSKLMNIIYSIEPDFRLSLARDLPSIYWWFIQIIAPITRLPPELLQQILLIIIDDTNDSPLVLMRVSKLWYTIVTGIWASLKLGTTTPKDVVIKKLERNQWLLDVLVDTDIDRGLSTPSKGAYEAIFAAIESTPRWRTFVVESCPAQTDLPVDLVDRGLQQSPDPAMGRVRILKIKYPCEMSPLLERLLRILGTTASEELTTVEINSPSVISFLGPTYPSLFHSIKELSLDTPGLPNPVDILPHLRQLEALTASHLSFPIYHDDVNLPFVHTLRHLTLRAVSIQWMSGRTFHVLKSCTILFPLRLHVPHTLNTTFPNCHDLTFQGYPLDILSTISAHAHTNVSVTSSCSYIPRASRQLVQFSSQALRENRLAPRILHISIEAMSWAWTKSFAFMSNLEELVIENAGPSSLGVQVLQSLIIHQVHANSLGTATTHEGENTPICPSLKKFGLRYRRWLQPSDHIDLFPEFISIIWSRQQSRFSLQSFRVWKGSDHKNPLELVEGSWISFEAFESLANNGEIKGENLLHLMVSGLWRILV